MTRFSGICRKSGHGFGSGHIGRDHLISIIRENIIFHVMEGENRSRSNLKRIIIWSSKERNEKIWNNWIQNREIKAIKGYIFQGLYFLLVFFYFFC